MKKTTSGGAAKAAQAKGGKAKALQEAASTARQYAYGLNRGPEVPDLVSWEPVLILTPHGAVVSFDLPDVPTTYRVLFYGNSPSGRLGYFQGTLRVR